jgi:hypothetical protein
MFIVFPELLESDDVVFDGGEVGGIGRQEER